MEKDPQPTVQAPIVPSEQPKVNEAIAAADKPADATPKVDSVTATAAPPAEPTAQDKSDVIEEVKDGSAPAAAKPEKPVDTRPAYLANNAALSEFFDRLASIVEKAGHSEMWGIQLKDSKDIPTVNVMIKFLRANEGNAQQAEEQLIKALEWRKKTNPTALVETGSFSATKFKGLGYITTYPNAGKDVVFTWNIYGSVKNIDETFGNIEEFINWRVALMESAIRDLRMGEATSVIDYDGEDPYQMIQVHDYQNVSFLRMNPNIRAASRETIEVFSTAYPELLKEKYFINVPFVMGWVFTALKVFLSQNTIRKFHPITNGANLAREFNGFGDQIPKEYGGKGEGLAETGRSVTLTDDVAPQAAVKGEQKETNQAATDPAPVLAVKEEAPQDNTVAGDTKKGPQ